MHLAQCKLWELSHSPLVLTERDLPRWEITTGGLDIRINCLEPEHWSRDTRHIQVEIMTPMSSPYIFFFPKEKKKFKQWYHLHQVSLCGLDGKESTYSAGDLGLIPSLVRYPGEGNGNPLQYSGLEDSVDRGALWATYRPWGCRVEHDWMTTTFTKGILTFK